MDLQASDRILELGCGDGWACRALAERIPEGLVIGLDQSDDQIRDARTKSMAFDNLLYLWSAAEQIPWQEDFFTRVVCVDSLLQFQDLEKVLRESYRVLAPGGTLWIVDQRVVEDENQRNDPSSRPAGASLLNVEPDLTLLYKTGFEDIAPHSPPNPAMHLKTSVNDLSSPAAVLVLSGRKRQE